MPQRSARPSARGRQAQASARPRARGGIPSSPHCPRSMSTSIKAREPRPGADARMAWRWARRTAGDLAASTTSRVPRRDQSRERIPAGRAHSYSRPDRPGEPSEYRRVPVCEAEALRDALDAAYGTLVVVDKRPAAHLGGRAYPPGRREVWIFLELEAVAAGDRISPRRSEGGDRRAPDRRTPTGGAGLAPISARSSRAPDAGRDSAMRNPTRRTLTFQWGRRCALGRRGYWCQRGETPIRRASAPRPRPSAHLWPRAGERSPRWPSSPRGRTSVRPAAGVASACPNSPGRTRRSISGALADPGARSLWPSCCPTHSKSRLRVELARSGSGSRAALGPAPAGGCGAGLGARWRGRRGAERR